MMKRNKYLAPRPRRSSALLMLIAIFLAGATYFVMDVVRHEAEVRSLSNKLEKLAQTSNLPAKLKLSSRDLEFQKKWLQLAAERDFPWKSLFQAIERSSGKEIELLEFVPDKNSRLIILRGEARHLNALTDFLEKLSRQRGLTGVHLSHQEAIQRERLETVSFEIKAKLI